MANRLEVVGSSDHFWKKRRYCVTYLVNQRIRIQEVIKLMKPLHRNSSTVSHGARNTTPAAVHYRSTARRVMASAATASLGAGALRVYDVACLAPQELKSVLARPRIDFTSILSTVSSP